MLRSTAYQKLESIFYKNIKNVFNLPKKGKTGPIKFLFEQITPENFIIRSYVKNFYKWFQHEENRIKKQVMKDEDNQELKFYQQQYTEAT